jgi:ubiquinone/menaquinone biosynthesis C-methylase UbiE
MSLYDPDYVAAQYDKFGDQDPFLVTSVYERVLYAVHDHFLKSYIAPGHRVLELGAGVGRFTVALAELGASVVVTDISIKQLDRNRANVHTRSLTTRIAAWKQIDVCDLSEFGSESFDAVVCYGGPLSYVFDLSHTAVDEMRRVLRPGGRAFVGVMSLWGTLLSLSRHFSDIAPDSLKKLVCTGNVHPDTFATARSGRQHLFTPEEFRTMLKKKFHLEHLATSNFLSITLPRIYEQQLDDPLLWKRFLELEVQACQIPSNLGTGQQLLAVVRK